jgi:hypothetical protein
MAAHRKSDRSVKLPRARVPVWREFIVRADELLTAFLELERAVCIHILPEEQALKS